jgi:hypothetical protein
MSRAALRRRLDAMLEAIEPRGTRIRVENPLPGDAADMMPVVIGTCGGCEVWGSESSRSILDAALPSGFERQPDGTIVPVKSGDSKPV